MGNSIGVGPSSKAAKVMKIDGEMFKVKTPAKVFDVIKDYPDHVLLDSDEFLLFKLRAKPLDLQFELKPKRIYLLLHLPRLPKPLRRARSGAHQRAVPRMEVIKTTRRSISDVSIMTRSPASTDSDDGWSSVDGPGPGTRVKIRLPKAVLERIMKESRDEGEAGEKILRLCLEDSASGSSTYAPPPVLEEGGDGGEERESVEEGAVDRSCFNIHALCSPCINQRKYARLPSM